MRRRLLIIGLALLPALAWAGPSRVTIRAYINVSSGCQAATVDLLNSLKAKYAPNLKLDTIDFGDQGRGFRRWQQSGYHCLTIEINGSPLVKFPNGGKWQAVAFLMPAGLNWTHADLEHAVQAAANGQLQTATEAEVAACAPPRKLNAGITIGKATSQGRTFTTVAINSRTAIAIPGTSADVARRAKNAATALKLWLSKPVKLGDLAVKQTTWGAAVLAAGKLIATATPGDGKAVGQQPKALAENWLSGIKHGLAGGVGH